MKKTTPDQQSVLPYGNIRSVAEIGQLVRQKRQADRLTQAELAAMSSVGTRLVSELENGKATIELAKALRVLETLGLVVYVAPRGKTGPPK
jgi:y4mF family transcriptional regulator